MTFTRAAFNEHGLIDAVEDGRQMTIPDDMTNRDRRRLAAWVEQGGAVQPYVKPPPSAEELRVAEFKALPERIDLVQRLKNATPAQIDTWLTNNVTNIAQVRAVLGAMLKYLATKNGD